MVKGVSSCPASNQQAILISLVWLQVAHNDSLGFNDTKTACYVLPNKLAQNPQPATQPIGSPSGSLCSNPDAHVFWDQ